MSARRRIWCGAGLPANPRQAGVRGQNLTRGESDRDAALRQAFVDGLQRALGTRVGFRPAKEGGGTLTIHYNSDEELNALRKTGRRKPLVGLGAATQEPCHAELANAASRLRLQLFAADEILRLRTQG